MKTGCRDQGSKLYGFVDRDRGNDAGCGKNNNSFHIQCSWNVGAPDPGNFYLYSFAGTGTCFCMGMHDRA